MNKENSPRVRRLVRCAVGNETYCIDGEWLDSIQVIENLYPSRSDDGSVGWIRRFDEKVKVFRLADQIYGPGRGIARNGVIMVLRRGEKLWALLVDKVTAAGEVSADRIFPLPSLVGDAEHGKFPFVVVDDAGVTLHLAPERVVPSEIAGGVSKEWHQPPPTTGISASRVRRSIPLYRQTTGAGSESDSTEISKVGRQILTFSLQHQTPMQQPVRFALSAGQTLEIVSGLPMIQVPHSPSFLVGLAKWQSFPIPVVDLAAWLGMTPAPFKEGCRFLLCRGTVGRNSRDAGLIAIPAVDELRKVDLPIEYKPWQQGVKWNASLALGIYRAERSMMVVPDLDAILSFQAATNSYKM